MDKKSNDNFMWKAKGLFLKILLTILSVIGCVLSFMYLLLKGLQYVFNLDSVHTIFNITGNTLLNILKVISWLFTSKIGCSILLVVLFIFLNSRYEKTLTEKRKEYLLNDKFELFFIELVFLILSWVWSFIFYDFISIGDNADTWYDFVHIMYWFCLGLSIINISYIIDLIFTPNSLYNESLKEEVKEDIKEIKKKIKKVRVKSKKDLLKSKLNELENKLKELKKND